MASVPASTTSVVALKDYFAPFTKQVGEEYFSNVRLSDESRDWLAEQGVPSSAMDGVAELRSAYVNSQGGLIFKVGPQDDNTAHASRVAYHVPVIQDGEFVDLIRFTREHPRGSFKAWGGRICRSASWLGSPEPAAVDAYGWAVPTRIWDSPLALLSAGRRGLVYLRQSWPSYRLDLLRSLPAVMGETAERSVFLNEVAWFYDKDKEHRPARWARVDPADIDGMARIAARRAVRNIGATA